MAADDTSEQPGSIRTVMESRKLRQSLTQAEQSAMDYPHLTLVSPSHEGMLFLSRPAPRIGWLIF